MSAAGVAARDGGWGRAVTALALVCVCLPYLYRIADVPLVKVDEFWGAQSSWELWSHGRFALPAFAGHLVLEQRTFFHPPGFYLVNALLIGPLQPSPFSVRLGPTLFAVLSFLGLYAALRRALAGAAHASQLAVAGVAIAAWNPLSFALARHARPETFVMLLGVCAVTLARPRALPALASGLFSGYAFFSHVFAWVLPGAIGLVLIWQRAWRALGAYGLGFSVFAAASAVWLLSGWEDFVAELRWLRGDLFDMSLQGYLAQRLAGQRALFLDIRLANVWLLEGFLILLLVLPPAVSMRRRALVLLGMIHVLLFLLPRSSPYYAISILYFCAGAIPIALSQRASAAGRLESQALRRLFAALVAVLLVPASGLGYLIWRDRDARYDATFRPLREAMDLVDPERRGITIGNEIQYLAFWDRPFLLRANPSLWTLESGADPPAALLQRWKERGVRFVLTSSLLPEAAPFGPLDPPLDAALLRQLRSSGRVLERVETRFYAEFDQPYREARVEVIDLGAPH